jgi:hypothetical protein
VLTQHALAPGDETAEVQHKPYHAALHHDREYTEGGDAFHQHHLKVGEVGEKQVNARESGANEKYGEWSSEWASVVTVGEWADGQAGEWASG